MLLSPLGKTMLSSPPDGHFMNGFGISEQNSNLLILTYIDSSI